MKLENFRNNGTNVIELNLSCPNLNSSQIVANKSGEVLKIISYIKNEFAKKNIKNNILIAKLAGSDMALLNSSKQAQEAEIDAITILPILYATGFYTGLIKQSQSLPMGMPLLGNIQGTIYGGGLGPITRQLVINLKKNISVSIIASGGCLGGMNSLILEKTDGFIQTMLTGAIATEIVTPFYPFTQEKILEIDCVVNNYSRILSKNKGYNVKLQNLS